MYFNSLSVFSIFQTEKEVKRKPIARKQDLISMYRWALVAEFVDISVYFRKLPNNFETRSIDFFKNLRFLRLTVLSYDLLVSRLLIYYKAVKKGYNLLILFLSEILGQLFKSSLAPCLTKPRSKPFSICPTVLSKHHLLSTVL